MSARSFGIRQTFNAASITVLQASIDCWVPARSMEFEEVDGIRQVGAGGLFPANGHRGYVK